MKITIEYVKEYLGWLVSKDEQHKVFFDKKEAIEYIEKILNV